MRESRHTRGELAALLTISLLSILALSPSGQGMRSLLLSTLSLEGQVFSWQSIGAAYLISLVLTLITQRSIDYYLLLKKSEQSLSRTLSILILFALTLRLPWQLWVLPLGYIVALSSLFDIYQKRDQAVLFLILGLGLGGLSLYSAKAILLVPLIWAIMYQQRTLYLRHLLALIHGIVLIALGAFGVLGVEPSLQLGQSWLSQWHEWHSIPWGVEGYAPYSWLALGLLGLVCISLVIYVVSSSYNSVRHSAQLQSLISMLFVGLGLWAFDASCPMLFASLLHLPLVVLLCKAIVRLPHLRYQRWTIIILMIALFIILFLS
ncbi:MAG: hypothetical protein Q4A61_03650 [Porphyromonadaceae bacterium]|nr:hypothetical protein [Porphyromonadaceae bacterium]